MLNVSAVDHSFTEHRTMPSMKDTILYSGALCVALLLYTLSGFRPHTVCSCPECPSITSGVDNKASAVLTDEDGLFRKEISAITAQPNIATPKAATLLAQYEKDLATLVADNKKLSAQLQQVQSELDMKTTTTCDTPISLTKLRELQGELRAKSAQFDACTASVKKPSPVGDEPSDEVNFKKVKKFYQFRFPIENEEPIPFIGADANPVYSVVPQCGYPKYYFEVINLVHDKMVLWTTKSPFCKVYDI